MEFKKKILKKYCSRSEIKKLEDEFHYLAVKGVELRAYNRRFQELAALCPGGVPDLDKTLEKYIEGLPQSIEGNVTASKPATLDEAMTIAQKLLDREIKRKSTAECNELKRKYDDKRTTSHGRSRYTGNERDRNYHQTRNSHHHKQNRTQEAAKAYVAALGYVGNKPLCNRCKLHHIGPCTIKCVKCQRIGHKTADCKASGANLQPVNIVCHRFGEKGHYQSQCTNRNADYPTRARVYVMEDGDAPRNPDIVTGTFLIN